MNTAYGRKFFAFFMADLQKKPIYMKKQSAQSN